MKRSTVRRQPGQTALRNHPAQRRAGRTPLVAAASLLLTLFVSAPVAAIFAEAAPDPGAGLSAPAPPASSPMHQQRQYVFSVGTLDRVTPTSVTLRFEDGATETYRLTAATTFQTQNADAQTLADLQVGAMAIVIAEEQSGMAVTVVNGGELGFHEAGPADIRSHVNACPPCDDPTP